ncbi:hypothetical protein ACIRUY_35745 [Streptomyces erythrochromogenes]|uniref:hypothetical protein n=1 Tax=Streptomyces erythrochromogenes TaxID=285574 RepID=UPI00343B9904
MSWDVLLLRLPDGTTSVQDMAGGCTPPPLGPQKDVLAAVSRAVPEADLSDPTWGSLLGPTWSMELNVGEEDPVDSIMLHIRGSGDDALTPVFRLADALGCKVLDCSSGDLIAPQELSGWYAFQEFRDRVIDPSH